jgi:hypothetical protein
MSQADRALIVVHRGDQWFGRLRRYRVSIDNRPAGYVSRRGPSEFPVEPGVHTVEVAMDWARSLPSRLEVAPGSRTDLRIARTPWWILKAGAPGAIFIIVANLLGSLLRHGGYMSGMGLLGLLVALLTTLGLTVALVQIASLLVKDCWAVWRLEPMSAPVSGSPSPVAG